ncbi:MULTISPECIES: LytR/AlgR family response regulator transcription factor [Croceitalea]|uniref:Response regulator n=1 Tax=Croceitalea vernalis TaxID=3075599 RepID=A0ABU3BL32_9FLAO|nr:MULTISPECIES: response regulator [unclassified Croceitalea]MDT0541032.1 response regulator [Croceitalea sp. P059]MDT0622881.1 response regulator [Croceitalea sp. P007]
MKYTTIVIDDSSIQRLATTFLVKNHVALEHIGSYGNPYEGLRAVVDKKADILFLDVLMDDIDAFELLDSVNLNCAIIMNSTWPRFAVKAFDYGINDFITKPIQKPRFEKSVVKVINQLKGEQSSIRSNKDYLCIDSLSNFSLT